GPFLTRATPFLVVSNVAWMAEITCGLGLLLAKTRTPAWIGGIALVAAIELGAREMFFGATMIGMLLLYARRDLSTRLLPGFVAVYAIALAMVVGLLPRGAFH